MDIIRTRQEKRASDMKNIRDSIEKAMFQGKTIIFNDIVLATMVNLNLSKVTSRDYVEAIFFELNLDKNEIRPNETVAKPGPVAKGHSEE